MTIHLKLLGQLLVNYQKPEDIVSENGLLEQLTKALLERALAEESTERAGNEKHSQSGITAATLEMERPGRA